MRWCLTLPRGDGRGLETIQGLPLSGEAVRRFLEDIGAAAPEQHERLVTALVRKAFPLSWKRLWWRDVARRVGQSPLRHVYLAALLARPAAKAEGPTDEWDRLRAMQQDPVRDGGKALSFATVCRVVEVRMGGAWWHCPARWPTVDGFAPYDAVWEAWGAIQQDRAFERLSLVRAIGITKAGDKAQGMVDADVREAMGG